MFGIATGKGIEIAIDAFGSDGITNEVIKGKMIDSYGLEARS